MNIYKIHSLGRYYNDNRDLFFLNLDTAIKQAYEINKPYLKDYKPLPPCWNKNKTKLRLYVATDYGTNYCYDTIIKLHLSTE